jgi:hypothetical protein
MKKLIAGLILTTGITAHALTPNEMLVMVGAVKYYNENCEGLTNSGFNLMNKGLERFDMDKTPVSEWEKNPMAVSGYDTANKFGCEGTKREATNMGFGSYIN